MKKPALVRKVFRELLESAGPEHSEAELPRQLKKSSKRPMIT